MRCRPCWSCLAPILLVLLALPAAAQNTMVWDGGGVDDDWSNPLNWDSNVAPGIADHLTIDSGFQARAPSIMGFSLPIETNNGTIIVQDGARLSLGFPGGLIVGSSNLFIRSGGGVIGGSFFTVGLDAGETGVVQILDPGSRWVATNAVLIAGGSGSANIDVLWGGLLGNLSAQVGAAVGGFGTVEVTGTDSRWVVIDSLYLGGSDTASGGTGVIDVFTNGLVDVGDTLKVWNPASLLHLQGGTVELRTLDLQGDLSRLDWFSGTLRFTDGLEVSNTSLTGNGLDVGAATALQRLEVANLLDVGAGGSGTFSVTRGAFASSGSARIAGAPGETGTATVNGFNSRWTTTDLVVGGSGSGSDGGVGTLRVEDQGSVTVSDRLTVLANDLVSIDGGAMLVGTAGALPFSGLALAADGTIDLEGGGRIRTSSFGRAGTFNWLDGTVEFTGDLNVQTGQGFGSNLSLVANQTLQVNGALRIGSAAAGSIAVGSGAIVDTRDAQVHGNGSLEIQGGLHDGRGGGVAAGQIGETGGTLLVTGGGALTLDGGGSIDLRGGSGGNGAPLVVATGGVGGLGGQLQVVDGSFDFNAGVLDQSGGAGGRGANGVFGGNGGDGGLGGNGSNFAMTIAGNQIGLGAGDAILLRGGSGGNGGSSSSLVGRGGGGGNGADLDLFAGVLRLEGGLVDLSGGSGGTGRTTGSTGTDGILNLDGGRLVTDATGPLGLDTTLSGGFDFVTGTLQLTDGAGFAIGTPGVVGSELGGNNVTILTDQTLEVDQTLSVGAGTVLTIDGGSVRSRDFDVLAGGELDVVQGILDGRGRDGAALGGAGEVGGRGDVGGILQIRNDVVDLRGGAGQTGVAGVGASGGAGGELQAGADAVIALVQFAQLDLSGGDGGDAAATGAGGGDGGQGGTFRLDLVGGPLSGALQLNSQSNVALRGGDGGAGGDSAGIAGDGGRGGDGGDMLFQGSGAFLGIGGSLDLRGGNGGTGADSVGGLAGDGGQGGAGGDVALLGGQLQLFGGTYDLSGGLGGGGGIGSSGGASGSAGGDGQDGTLTLGATTMILEPFIFGSAQRILGNYTQTSAGTLRTRVSGPEPTGTPTGYLVLEVAGTANLAGDLDLDIVDPFVTRFANQFLIVDAENITGSFATGVGDLPALAGTLDWKIVQTQKQYKIRIIDVVPVAPGAPGAGVAGGGSGQVGGIDFEFASVLTSDDFVADHVVVPAGADLAEFEFSAFDFQLPGDSVQIWDLAFGGSFSGPVTLSFGYDETLLAPGTLEADLVIQHFSGGIWSALATLSVDEVANIITVETPSFSSFALGVPEPSLAVLGLTVLLAFSVRVAGPRRGLS